MVAMPAVPQNVPQNKEPVMPAAQPVQDEYTPVEMPSGQVPQSPQLPDVPAVTVGSGIPVGILVGGLALLLLFLLPAKKK